MATGQQAGKNLLLQRSADGGSTWTTVADCRTTDGNFAREAVDGTHKGSNSFRDLVPDAGIKSLDLSIEGVFSDDSTQRQLLTDLLGGTLEDYRLVDISSSGVSQAYEGTFQVVSYDLGGAYNDAQTFSASLQSSGAVTVTTYTAP